MSFYITLYGKILISIIIFLINMSNQNATSKNERKNHIVLIMMEMNVEWTLIDVFISLGKTIIGPMTQ